MREILPVMLFVTLSVPAAAQTTDGGFDQALSTSMASTAKAMFATVRRDLAEAADTMPPDDYAYQPHRDSRTFAALIGHVASANYFFWDLNGLLEFVLNPGAGPDPR
jgi:DinB superfamily